VTVQAAKIVAQIQMHLLTSLTYQTDGQVMQSVLHDIEKSSTV